MPPKEELLEYKPIKENKKACLDTNELIQHYKYTSEDELNDMQKEVEKWRIST